MYLVRKETLGHEVLQRFMARDMASAERKAQEWCPGVRLTRDSIFRHGYVDETQVTILQVQA